MDESITLSRSDAALPIELVCLVTLLGSAVILCWLVSTISSSASSAALAVDLIAALNSRRLFRASLAARWWATPTYVRRTEPLSAPCIFTHEGYILS